MVCVGTKQVDYLNRLMFTVKLVIMVAVLGLLLPRAEGQHLLSMPLGQGLLLAACRSSSPRSVFTAPSRA